MTMNRSWKIIVALAIAALPPAAQAQGRLDLLPTGAYECALPGSAAGRAWIAQPARGFAILRASLYRTPEGQGTYLMKGDRVEFTRGPMRGTVMIRVAPRLLRIVEEDGTPGRLRCHRAGPVPD